MSYFYTAVGGCFQDKAMMAATRILWCTCG